MSAKSILSFILIGLTGVGTLAAPSTSRADSQSVLFLGISRSAEKLELDETVTNFVRERLRIQHVPLVEDDHDLRPEQRIIKNPKLLVELAQRKKATWVLGGQMKQNTDPAKGGREYAMAGILVDVNSPIPLLTQGLCSDCQDVGRRADYMSHALLALLAKRSITQQKKHALNIGTPILYVLGATTAALGLAAIPVGVRDHNTPCIAVGGASLGLAAGALFGSYFLSSSY